MLRGRSPWSRSRGGCEWAVELGGRGVVAEQRLASRQRTCACRRRGRDERWERASRSASYGIGAHVHHAQQMPPSLAGPESRPPSHPHKHTSKSQNPIHSQRYASNSTQTMSASPHTTRLRLTLPDSRHRVPPPMRRGPVGRVVRQAVRVLWDLRNLRFRLFPGLQVLHASQCTTPTSDQLRLLPSCTSPGGSEPS